ncbi:MAG TPA: NusG domain II-containing protein [Candidatus Cloacimonadota bacterium]|nr:NusG domain II-containing protein [Candidatus Cloacimonadota bacterium]
MKKILKLFTVADIVLIVILLIIAGFFLCKMKSDLTGKKVEIHYHNKLVGTYSLHEDQIIKVDEGIVVEIAHQKVRIKENTCPHQDCVKQGWSDSLPIICVPNELSVVIKGEKEDMLITR